MNQAFIGIGSNINNPNYRIFKVLKQLNHSKEITIVKKSSIYSSRPMGPQFQPNYSNIVIEIITSLEPSELLVFLKKLEKVHNRKTTKRLTWDPMIFSLSLFSCSEVGYAIIPWSKSRDSRLIDALKTKKQTKHIMLKQICDLGIRVVIPSVGGQVVTGLTYPKLLLFRVSK